MDKSFFFPTSLLHWIFLLRPASRWSETKTIGERGRPEDGISREAQKASGGKDGDKVEAGSLCLRPSPSSGVY